MHRNHVNQKTLSANVMQPMIDKKVKVKPLTLDFGFTGFSRPDFSSKTRPDVAKDVNETLDKLGYKAVDPSDYDIAHKVPIDAIRKTVMHYVWDQGKVGRDDLIRLTDVLYTQNTGRKANMVSLRDNLVNLVGKQKQTLTEMNLKVIDAANDLIEELNNAPDNLGLGIPTENRSIGANFDLVIDGGNLTPRSAAIYTEYKDRVNVLHDKKGPRTSQITSDRN